MMRWASVVTMAVLAMAAFSCKKSEPPRDSNSEPPPNVIQVHSDSGLLADQTKMVPANTAPAESTDTHTGTSGNTGTTTGPTPSPAPTTGPSPSPSPSPTTGPSPSPSPSPTPAPGPTTGPAPTPGPGTTPPAGGGKKPSDKTIAEITAVVNSMKQAVAANPKDLPAQFMTDDCVAALKPLFTGPRDIAVKMAKLKDLVKAKGIDVSGDSGMSFGTGGGPAEAMEKLDLSKMTWEETDEGVFMVNGKDKKLAVKTATGWKLGLSKEEKAMLPLFTNVLTAQDKFATTLMAGLNDGSITKANFKAKSDEIAKTTIGPAFAELMKAAMGGALGTGGGGK